MVWSIPPDILLPAAGQGALGIEMRANDDRAAMIAQYLDDPATHAAVTAERSALSALAGGCLAPIGVWAEGSPPERGDTLTLSATVLSADGKQKLSAAGSRSPQEAVALGEQVATELLTAGAAQLIAQSRPGG
jgi:hydroxymethylbilane synthase